MALTPKQIDTVRGKLADGRALRDRTGAPLGDCFKALIECHGNHDRAVEWLRTRMLCR